MSFSFSRRHACFRPLPAAMREDAAAVCSDAALRLLPGFQAAQPRRRTLSSHAYEATAAEQTDPPRSRRDAAAARCAAAIVNPRARDFRHAHNATRKRLRERHCLRSCVR